MPKDIISVLLSPTVNNVNTTDLRTRKMSFFPVRNGKTAEVNAIFYNDFHKCNLNDLVFWGQNVARPEDFG